jgi:hypothetical protein
MANSIYGQNFEAERVQRENEKYGPRMNTPVLAAHSHVYDRHSIEPAYGHYDRPLNESI